MLVSEMPSLFDFATNFWYLVVLLAVCTLVLYVLLVRAFPLDKVGWKKADYWWLSIAAFGLVGLAGENRRDFAAARKDDAAERVRFSFHALRNHLHGATYLCTEFIRGEHSPSDFEEVQKQHEIACKWRNATLKSLPDTVEQPFPKLTFSDTRFPSVITNRSILETKSLVEKMYSDYEAGRLSFIDVEERTKQSGLEQAMTVLSPILLCVALALRITKVIGEVRLERKPNRSVADAA